MTFPPRPEGVSEERYREAVDRTLRLRALMSSPEYAQAIAMGTTTRQPSTYTYFIQVEDERSYHGPGGPIKIGCAADPSSRLSQLQTACPFELYLMGYVPGGEALERELHEKWAHLRMRGEWFRATEELEADLYERIFDYEEECLG